MGRVGRLDPLFGIKPSTKKGRKKVQGVGKSLDNIGASFLLVYMGGRVKG